MKNQPYTGLRRVRNVSGEKICVDSFAHYLCAVRTVFVKKYLSFSRLRDFEGFSRGRKGIMYNFAGEKERNDERAIETIF